VQIVHDMPSVKATAMCLLSKIGTADLQIVSSTRS